MDHRPTRAPWFLALLVFPLLGPPLSAGGFWLADFGLGIAFFGYFVPIAVPALATTLAAWVRGVRASLTIALVIATSVITAVLTVFALLAMLHHGASDTPCPGGRVYC